ncbi:hypothetical protein EVG20_g8800 [Dentipellis fragilis]|uniref:Uncharacterized protein n=1 Tax=Dentipellis fragilis TaxID=205917 RepID=A0A4Y9Y4Q2_9AGAM|nr:hypothetical protein EVG20_g8800 [Dentipellis fragilis]
MPASPLALSTVMTRCSPNAHLVCTDDPLSWHMHFVGPTTHPIDELSGLVAMSDSGMVDVHWAAVSGHCEPHSAEERRGTYSLSVSVSSVSDRLPLRFSRSPCTPRFWQTHLYEGHCDLCIFPSRDRTSITIPWKVSATQETG